VVATELVGTSISSGASKSTGFRKHLEDNPHIRLFEIRLRGYTRCTVIRERWYADLRVVDTIERRGAPVPDPRHLRRGERPSRGGTGLEWGALTTTYGGAWVRP
jgi:phosphodiesterase/alkaline phosphatase D-like protein